MPEFVNQLVDLVVDHSHGFLSEKKLTGIGALILVAIVATQLVEFLNYLYVHFIRGCKNLKRYGEWAVVTGATDGIGKAMAIELAKKGLNVVLISRTESKLKECMEELKAKFPQNLFKTVAIDYSVFGENERKKVASALEGLDVGVLINNVGMSYDYTTYFHELTDSRVDQIMSVNVGSTTWMTRIVLQKMLDKKKGAVVNIASAAGVSTSPLLAQYGAAKSYVAMFSRALHFEYAAKGVDFQCQVPMFVTTKLAKIKHASLTVPSEKQYAYAAVKAIGYEPLISPYWSHAILIWLLTTLPESLIAWGTQQMHEGIRRKGLKKASEKKA